MYLNRITFIGCFLATSLLISCQAIEVANKKTTYEVGYSDIKLNDKNLRYIDLVDQGQAEYYSNIQKIIKKSKKEGYVLYYGGMKMDVNNKIDSLKLFTLNMCAAKDASMSMQEKILKKQGYALKKEINFLGIDNNLDYLLDIGAKAWLDSYEKINGPILLSKKDSASTMMFPKIIPIAKKMKISDVDNRTRAKYLAEEVFKSKDKKIILLYNYEYKRAFISHLDSLTANTPAIQNISTVNDTNYVHTIKTSDLRAKSDYHIIQNGYIDNMDGFVNIKTSLTQKLELFNLNSDNKKYEIYPNSPNALRVSIDYKSLSIGYSFTPDFLNTNKKESIYGKSSGFNGQLGLQYDRWFNNFSVRYIKGFYINNTKDFDSTWREGKPYISEPNLYYSSLEGTTGYKFNPKFSLKSITSQTERQLKSSGSVITSVNYKYYETVDKSSPLLGDSIKNSVNFEVGANIGYYFNIVIMKSFYISLGVSPGYGVVVSKVNKNTAGGKRSDNYSSTMFRASGIAAVGYNAERLYMGIYTDFTGGAFYNKNAAITNTTFANTYQAFVGYRFEASEKLRATKMYK